MDRGLSGTGDAEVHDQGCAPSLRLTRTCPVTMGSARHRRTLRGSGPASRGRERRRAGDGRPGEEAGLSVTHGHSWIDACLSYNQAGRALASLVAKLSFRSGKSISPQVSGTLNVLRAALVMDSSETEEGMGEPPPLPGRKE